MQAGSWLAGEARNIRGGEHAGNGLGFQTSTLGVGKDLVAKRSLGIEGAKAEGLMGIGQGWGEGVQGVDPGLNVRLCQGHAMAKVGRVLESSVSYLSSFYSGGL